MSVRAYKWVHSLLPILDLPPTERCVLLVLAFHHNDQTGECFPAMKTIAGHCGVGERRARQAVQLLAAWRIIKVRRGGTAAGNASNRYTLFGTPRRPKESGKRMPVSGAGKPAQKSRFQSGSGLPDSNRQTGADDRDWYSKGEEAQANGASGLRVVNGGRHA
ncbi:helix-turn-helix domain-containing protein [Rhodobaculum claviforme]|uniref:Helix-turn-helix domain-containing protein n=1 Tax=Rhodobaculum claviforme TaxID=1549854 RepID=A0A934WIU3_9RHOB|nr:helix-turn-helix domain-containing protein [Rhodobaculum claviforme]MBK5926863.1 hypothetical protein [Rhodobaculum claviforme]